MIDPDIEADVIKDSAPEDVQLRLRFMFDQRALAGDQIEGYQQAIVDLELQLKETHGLLGLQYALLADIENEIKTLQVEADLDAGEDEGEDEDRSPLAPTVEITEEDWDAMAKAAVADLIRSPDPKDSLASLISSGAAVEIRKEAGWSQKDVGEHLGLDPRYGQSKVSSWERGKTTPTEELAEAYHQLLLRLRG